MLKKLISSLLIAGILVGCSTEEPTVEEETTDSQEQVEEVVGDEGVDGETVEDKTVLTTEDVESQLKLSFEGYSGRGKMVVESDLETPLRNSGVEVENNGFLKNGDVVTLDLETGHTGTFTEWLENKNYELEEGFNPTFTVEGLQDVAETGNDITNVDDIIRMAKEDYESRKNRLKTTYKDELIGYWYRDFPSDEDERLYERSVGRLIVLYDMEKTIGNGSVYKHVIPQEYTNILVDENGKADLSKMNDIYGKEEHNKSVETVIAVLESEGFEQFFVD